ncbi:MAG: (2Fe-2S) ferredoxin domain-containing protein [Bacteroidetes bacterium]|nr:MAG: (2Fe-2S) ferredoxin domain-containing protein [Bacteroidota bacterium]
MSRFERHLFICTNERPDGHPRGCCAQKGGAVLKERFKEELQSKGLSPRFRANASGCLDACEHGAVVVVYPDGVWYGGVTPEDAAEIVERHLQHGEPVERLLIRDPKYGRTGPSEPLSTTP